MARFFCLLLLVAVSLSPARALDEAELTGVLDAVFAPPIREDGEAAAMPEAGLLPSVRVRVSSRRHTILSCQMNGRVASVHVRDGDRFSLGDVLVTMDSAMHQVHLDRARAVYRRQEVIYGMVRELADLGTKGEGEAEIARMELEQAAADVRSAELLLEKATIKAPFSGRVADVYAREDLYIQEGRALLEILDDSALELEFIISSRWLRWFTPGYRFNVVIDETGNTHEAVLERLGGKVDPLSQSVKAYAIISEPTPDLMEGMSGAAVIIPPGGDQP